MIALLLGLAAAAPLAAAPPLDPPTGAVTEEEPVAYVRAPATACAGSQCVHADAASRGDVPRFPARLDGDGVLVAYTPRSYVGDDLSYLVHLRFPADDVAWLVARPLAGAPTPSSRVAVEAGQPLASFDPATGLAAWNDDGVCVERRLPVEGVARVAPARPIVPVGGTWRAVVGTRVWSTPDGGEVLAVLGCQRWRPGVDDLGTRAQQPEGRGWRVERLGSAGGAARIRVRGAFTEVVGWVDPAALTEEPVPEPSSFPLVHGCFPRTPRAPGVPDVAPWWYDRPGGVPVGRLPDHEAAPPHVTAGGWDVRPESTPWGELLRHVAPTAYGLPGAVDPEVTWRRLREAPGVQVEEGGSCRAHRVDVDGAGVRLVPANGGPALALRPAVELPDVDRLLVPVRALLSRVDAAPTTVDVWPLHQARDRAWAASDGIGSLQVGNAIWRLTDRPCGAPDRDGLPPTDPDALAPAFPIEVQEVRTCRSATDVLVGVTQRGLGSTPTGLVLAYAGWTTDGVGVARWLTRAEVRLIGTGGTVAHVQPRADRRDTGGQGWSSGQTYTGWIAVPGDVSSSASLAADVRLEVPVWLDAPGGRRVGFVPARGTTRLVPVTDDAGCRVWRPAP